MQLFEALAQILARLQEQGAQTALLGYHRGRDLRTLLAAFLAEQGSQ